MASTGSSGTRNKSGKSAVAGSGRQSPSSLQGASPDGNKVTGYNCRTTNQIDQTGPLGKSYRLSSSARDNSWNCELEKVTAGGPQVKTVANGTGHSLPGGTGYVVLEADAGTALGVSFARGGIVRQVAPQGQAATKGVQTGWRLTEIKLGATLVNGGSVGFHVTPNSTPREILDAIATIRKRGKPYSICFSLLATTMAGAEISGEPRVGGEEARSGGGDYSSGTSAAACDAVVRDTSTESPTIGQAVVVVGEEALAVEKQAAQGSEDDKHPGNGSSSAVVELKEAKEGALVNPMDNCGDGASMPSLTEGEGGNVGRRGGGHCEGGTGAAEVTVVTEEGAAAAGREDGEVTLIYEMYDENFPIKGGSITASEIDETYCLSFAMPNCTLHLGTLSPSDRYARENAGESVPYIPENPPGNFHGLVDGGTYWVYVSRSDEEEKRDRERMERVLQGMKEEEALGASKEPGRRDDGRGGLESCSCVYGNPCVDEYGCKDWISRYAVARANGWKGF